MKIFIFSTIALLSCNVMLSALNYQQNKQLRALEVSNTKHTNLLILESNPDYFADIDVRNNCLDRGE
jgi:hypothetical protein